MPDLMHPKSVRLEVLTPDGWVLAGGHAMQSLLHPERYPERLRERGKFGRATLLDDRLRPTKTVWVADDVPADPSILVPTKEGNGGWRLPDVTKDCGVCGEEHPPPHDGRCLL